MRVERDVVLDTTSEEAWRLLTDPDELATWLGTPIALDLEPGGVAAYIEPDGRVRHAVVEQVTPGERLSFVWWSPGDDLASRVVFELTEVEDGVKVAVSETHASTAGATIRLSAGAIWDDRLFDLERRCLERQFVLV
ncbi:MAG TPA: SRPBCC domain-containing protein [Acidimicrobiales bacterium]|jgi:uncharacterized protein YndB with AHSA1/START domain